MLQVENIRKAIAFLREEPRRFDMMEWLKRVPEEVTPCGTVCCFAGAGSILCMKEKEMPLDFPNLWGALRGKGPVEVATEYFGLSRDACNPLRYDRFFYLRDWPYVHRVAYLCAKTPAARVEALASYLEEVIAKHGGAA